MDTDSTFNKEIAVTNLNQPGVLKLLDSNGRVHIDIPGGSKEMKMVLRDSIEMILKPHKLFLLYSADGNLHPVNSEYAQTLADAGVEIPGYETKSPEPERFVHRVGNRR